MLSYFHKMSNWGQTPISLFVSARPIGEPEIHAVPELWGYIPVRTEMRVVLPAPFGPKNPKISPFFSPKVKGLSAIFPFSPLSVWYCLLSPLISRGSDEFVFSRASSAAWRVTETSTIS